MAEAMTKTAWKRIIDDINSLIDDPPSGCDASPRLDEIQPGVPVRWSVRMVQEVQDKLVEICNENEFERPTKWSQKMIDEIRDAIERGWCGCTCCGYFMQISFGSVEAETGHTTIECTTAGGETSSSTGTPGGQVRSLTVVVDGVTTVNLTLPPGGDSLVSSLPPNSLSTGNRKCVESVLTAHGIDATIPPGA